MRWRCATGRVGANDMSHCIWSPALNYFVKPPTSPFKIVDKPAPSALSNLPQLTRADLLLDAPHHARHLVLHVLSHGACLLIILQSGGSKRKQIGLSPWRSRERGMWLSWGTPRAYTWCVPSHRPAGCEQDGRVGFGSGVGARWVEGRAGRGARRRWRAEGWGGEGRGGREGSGVRGAMRARACALLGRPAAGWVGCEQVQWHGRG